MPGPGPLNWTITPLDLPWHINLISYNGSTGLVHGTISHMEISAAGAAFGFVIDGTKGGASDGTVKFIYSPSPARDLRPADGSSRTGCGSVWQSRSESPMGAEHTSMRGGRSAKPHVK